MIPPWPRFGVEVGVWVLDVSQFCFESAFSRHPRTLPWSGEGNRFFFLGASTSPLFFLVGRCFVQGCQPWPVTSLGGFWSSLGRFFCVPI
jgi:hypothetical protein